MRQLKTVSEMIQDQCKKQVELQTTNLPRPRRPDSLMSSQNIMSKTYSIGNHEDYSRGRALALNNKAEIAILLENSQEATEAIKPWEGKMYPRVDGKKTSLPATAPPISGADSKISPVSRLDFLLGCWPRASIPIRHELEDGPQMNAVVNMNSNIQNSPPGKHYEY
ncbi:hypothetical protein HGM15179_013960 [Zosterops borbonicus]|uniref:Uncharacterized protein n=1 Tax=Zosterops borbonicus TaxID=364589 RepID=A0A8K1LGN6_9PASS|nr:hypothetical protein HGM15179_013960 [Zosterops borbonicus]